MKNRGIFFSGICFFDLKIMIYLELQQEILSSQYISLICYFDLFLGSMEIP